MFFLLYMETEYIITLAICDDQQIWVLYGSNSCCDLAALLSNGKSEFIIVHKGLSIYYDTNVTTRSSSRLLSIHKLLLYMCYLQRLVTFPCSPQSASVFVGHVVWVLPGNASNYMWYIFKILLKEFSIKDSQLQRTRVRIWNSLLV